MLVVDAACNRKKRLSVALIDDDVSQRQILRAQFAKLGAVVTTFASGLDFLNQGCVTQKQQADWYHHLRAPLVG